MNEQKEYSVQKDSIRITTRLRPSDPRYVEIDLRHLPSPYEYQSALEMPGFDVRLVVPRGMVVELIPYLAELTGQSFIGPHYDALRLLYDAHVNASTDMGGDISAALRVAARVLGEKAWSGEKPW